MRRFSSSFQNLGCGLSLLVRRIKIGILTAVLVIAHSSASGQTPQWADDFDMGGLYGRVFGLGTWNGRLIAGGVGFPTDGVAAKNVVAFDGNRWQPLGSGVTGALTSTIQGGPIVRAAAVYGGELVVAGRFLTAGGVAADCIARWNGTSWQPLGSGLTNSFNFTPVVYALTVFNGELYAGGDFDTAGGQAIRGLAKWNGSQWSPVGSGLNDPFDLAVYSMTIHAGALYVGGNFAMAGGQTVNNIARWDGTSFSALGVGVPNGNGDVQSLESFQGQLYIGGNFYGIGGIAASNIARWNGTSFSAVGAGMTGTQGVGTTVACMKVWNGSLHVGGTFDLIGSLVVRNVAAWNGSQWISIGGVDGSSTITTALAMTEFQGRLIVGGEFANAGPAFADGSPVATQSIASFDGFSWGQVGAGHGTDEEVYKLLRWRGGIVATGRFYNAGMSVSTQVAFFDGFQWRKIGTFNGNVLDAVEWNGDLVVTGGFTQVGNVGATSIARFDGTQWYPIGGGAGGSCVAVYQGQLYAGSTGSPKRWTGTGWVTFGTPLFGQMNVMHVHGTRLYIGGIINSPFGIGNIVSWDGTTTTGLGTGVNQTVESIASHGADLVVGGWFTTAGGAPASRIARWNGTSWSAFGSGLPGTVHALASDGTTLYVGGDFSTTGFPAAPGNYIVRWNGSSFQPLGTGMNASVVTLLIDPSRGSLYAGGYFQEAGSRPSWHIARWGMPTLTIAFSQPSGPGTPTFLTHGQMTIGKEYYAIYSPFAAPTGVGTGPFAGLFDVDPANLIAQTAVPIGTPPFHDIASSTSATFGPYPLPPLTIEALLFEVNAGGIVDSTSFCVRAVIQ